MESFDVFNGDADGICSLIQYRLAYPKHSTLVTGTKREIELLHKIPKSKGYDIFAFDISFDKNFVYIKDLLASGSYITWFDHHRADNARFTHKNLKTFIDFNTNTCTSLIVNSFLKNKYFLWAITGAFGDNLNDISLDLCKKIKLHPKEIKILYKIGVSINYNSYGLSTKELIFKPEEIYNSARHFSDPLNYFEDDKIKINEIYDLMRDDLVSAKKIKTQPISNKLNIVILPNMDWSKRVIGTFSNYLVNLDHNRANVIFLELENNEYHVSIRSPKNNPKNAYKLAEKFNGGGRERAAGINSIKKNRLNELINFAKKLYQ